MISRRAFLSRSTPAGAALAATPATTVVTDRQRGSDSGSFSYYTRMFPQLARTPPRPNSTLEQGLAELGQAMKDVESTQSNVHEMPLAGYTYLGRFIDHDLTLDITPLEFAQPTAECIHNFRAQFLDLDHVYAGDPNISSFLYETDGPPGNERFLLGIPDLFAVALVGCADMSSHNHNTCQ